MPVTTTALASLLDISGGVTTPKNAGLASSDAFMTLLDIGEKPDNATEKNTGSGKAAPKEKPKHGDAQAVSLDVPVQVAQPSEKMPHKQPEAVKSAVRPEAKPVPDHSEPPAKPKAEIASSQKALESSEPKPSGMKNTKTPQENMTNQQSAAANGESAQKAPADLEAQVQDVQARLQALLALFQDAVQPVEANTGQAAVMPLASEDANSAMTEAQDTILTLQSLLRQMQQALDAQPDTEGHYPALTPATLEALQAVSEIDATDIAKLAPWLAITKPSGPAGALPMNALMPNALPETLPADTENALTQLQADAESLLAKLKQLMQSHTAPEAAPKQSEKPAEKIPFIEAFAGNTAVAAASNAVPQTTAVQPGHAQAAITQAPAISAAPAGQNGMGSDMADGGGSRNQPGAPSMPQAGSIQQAQSATPAGAPSFARALSQTATPTPMLDQVRFHVKTALTDGSSRIHIRLDPAELGKLDIRLTVQQDGKTGVVITADNRATLDLLQKDTQGLMRALNDAGLSADSGSLNFNLRGQQEQAQDNERAAMTYRKAQPEDDIDPDVPLLGHSYVVELAEGLDIKI